jgi:hypothetical protein
VIRLLTRLLFVWFIKEKELIPEDLFDLERLQKNILKRISPFNEEATLYKEASRESIYYKATDRSTSVYIFFLSPERAATYQPRATPWVKINQY